VFILIKICFITLNKLHKNKIGIRINLQNKMLFNYEKYDHSYYNSWDDDEFVNYMDQENEQIQHNFYYVNTTVLFSVIFQKYRIVKFLKITKMKNFDMNIINKCLLKNNKDKFYLSEYKKYSNVGCRVFPSRQLSCNYKTNLQIRRINKFNFGQNVPFLFFKNNVYTIERLQCQIREIKKFNLGQNVPFLFLTNKKLMNFKRDYNNIKYFIKRIYSLGINMPLNRNQIYKKKSINDKINNIKIFVFGKKIPLKCLIETNVWVWRKNPFIGGYSSGYYCSPMKNFNEIIKECIINAKKHNIIYLQLRQLDKSSKKIIPDDVLLLIKELIKFAR
jgi:hypothetical protein